MTLTSEQVRSRLVDALDIDMVGPKPGSGLEEERLPQSPARWYLTGFLVPIGASEKQKGDETAAEGVEVIADGAGTDDASPAEPAAARKALFPSSLGVSLLVSKDTKALDVTVRWGDYRFVQAAAAVDEGETGDQVERKGSGSGENTGDDPEKEKSTEVAKSGLTASRSFWQRIPKEVALRVDLPEQTASPTNISVPESNGLSLALSVRKAFVPSDGSGVSYDRMRSVSLFLVNRRNPENDDRRDEAFAFQAELDVHSAEPFLPRPDLHGLESDDWDDRVADLQYRNAFEYAVGHGVSTTADVQPDGSCSRVRTCWIPRAVVELVAPASIEGVELSMERLAELADGNNVKENIGALLSRYRGWIETQKAAIPGKPRRRNETGVELLNRASVAARRIEAGIEALSDPQVLEAFRISNRAMAAAARRRTAQQSGTTPESVQPPRWRPFQLAFILMNITGIVDPRHDDRSAVDLLFFPTGGGKTEAYLGLSAFTLVLRRLRNRGLSAAGVSVLMRYTLRLLTLDQLGRAAALICALEMERKKDIERLGKWPFEIGLWVGLGATPNRMGEKGDNNPDSARAKTIAYKNGTRRESPIPLEECPWCGKVFTKNSFSLAPNQDRPTDLQIRCADRACDFSGNNFLPIIAVDEPIYRRLPCFLIATVDKFAGMPWLGRSGLFFGGAGRGDDLGLYGPCDQGKGSALSTPVPPPDLIIQDELHLISGPLGTIAGLYESAFDELCARKIDDKVVRPKIVASTATVRRAEKQIRALFNRRTVDIFPPPGPNRRDSFFAVTQSPQQSNPRIYVGVAAQGRSPKVVLLRTYLTLMAAAQKMYQQEGGKKNKTNPVDPYMTLLGYFNSLRELGGSRRIVEDEVKTRLTKYGARMRIEETEGIYGDREISYDPVELTSRVSTGKVADAKRRLALPFREDGRVDVAIATNMISVGLDIIRLGLMVVFGQPKTSAEYIQATSRVGRDPNRPGIIVTLLNIHKPRDRSHYERFASYHQSFYRSVEATSVTPFSPRALDRGLAGTLVALVRHGHVPMTPPKGAVNILSERNRLDFAVQAIAERAKTHAALPPAEAESLRQRVADRAKDLLDEWSRIAQDYQASGTNLQYAPREEGGAKNLLYNFLDSELKTLPRRHMKFRANRSMRDVEPVVNLWMKTLDNIEVPEDEE